MQTTIKRQELKRIFDIACTTWKPTIEEYAKRNPFGEEITFTEEEINKMLKASTKEQLPIVKEVFGIKETWRDITTLEKAIDILGNEDVEVQKLNVLLQIDNIDEIIAEQKLVIIIKAVNEGWKPNFDDTYQSKWFLWWYLGKNFRLYCADGSSYVPPRLCLESKEKAIFMSENFKSLYEKYLNK